MSEHVRSEVKNAAWSRHCGYSKRHGAFVRARCRSSAALLDAPQELLRPGDELDALALIVDFEREQRNVLLDIAGPHLVAAREPRLACLGGDHLSERTDLLDVDEIDLRAQLLQDRQSAEGH